MSDTNTRLREAIQEVWGGSIRGFQREMERREVRGSSYATIYSYLRGDTQPSRDFLEAAADVLGVRLRWLRFGEGEPTGEEEVAGQALLEDAVADFEGAVEEVFLPNQLSGWARGAIWEAWKYYRPFLSEQTDAVHQEADSRSTARRVVEAIAAPLGTLGIEPAGLRRRDLNNYVTAACQALMAVGLPPG